MDSPVSAVVSSLVMLDIVNNKFCQKVLSSFRLERCVHDHIDRV